jgi:hypothetical protein
MFLAWADEFTTLIVKSQSPALDFFPAFAAEHSGTWFKADVRDDHDYVLIDLADDLAVCCSEFSHRFLLSGLGMAAGRSTGSHPNGC